MANTFITAQQVSGLAVSLLSRQLVLPNTVSRIPGGEYAGRNGDTVTVTVPQPGSARVQDTPGAEITWDDLTESSVDVSLSHLYNGVRVTDESLSLELVDFGAQVTAIQVDAVARGAEDELATAMNDLTADDSLATDGSDIEEMLLAAREALSSAHVPAGDRFLAVSPQVATYLLQVDKFTKVNEAGDDSALRDAVIGSLYGFQVVESNGLDDGTGVAYHRSGFAFASRVPVSPRGANDSATRTAGGVGLRQIFQYNPNILSDQSVVSTFAGASVVDSDRVFKFDTAAA